MWSYVFIVLSNNFQITILEWRKEYKFWCNYLLLVTINQLSRTKWLNCNLGTQLQNNYHYFSVAIYVLKYETLEESNNIDNRGWSILPRLPYVLSFQCIVLEFFSAFIYMQTFLVVHIFYLFHLLLNLKKCPKNCYLKLSFAID